MGKKIVDEDLVMNIIVNGDAGKKELYELEEAARDLSSENNSLEQSLSRHEKQIAGNEKTIARYTASLSKNEQKKEKLTQLYDTAREKATALNNTYKSLSDTERNSPFGQRIKKDMLEASEASRKLAAQGQNTLRTNTELTNKISLLARETEKLKQKQTESTTLLEKNKQAISAASERTEVLRKNFDITKLSITELNKELTRTNALYKQATPNTPEWEQHRQQLIKLRAQQEKLGLQAKSTQGILTRAANNINQYWNFVATSLAGIVGVVLGLKSAINKYIEFTDVLANVQKTTKLTQTEVKELNTELAKINTRSAQEEMLGLARIGGKLGIEGKENLLGFARAADQINVALKEDLGGDTEEAINHVGKLVDIFKVQEFGVEQGLLKVGSVINELGAASTANEGYIVEFTKRAAGVAPMAQVSIQSVMGIAATLDKFGQQCEASGTAYTQTVTAMFSKTDKFAKVAGMSMQNFADLLKNDANEAFLKVLEGLKGNDAAVASLVANLGNLGIDGSRATTVLGTLASNTETIREQQQLANKAFAEGISLTNEYNIKNETAAAQLDRAKKKLNEMVRDLGEKLQPALAFSTSSMSYMIRVISALYDFLNQYGSTLLYLVGVIGAYIVATQASIVLSERKAVVLKAEAILIKAVTAITQLHIAVVNVWKIAYLALAGNIKGATQAIKVFYATTKIHPVGLLVAALAAAGIALYKFLTHTTAAQKAVKDFQTELAIEQENARQLFNAYAKTNENTQERVDILQKLKEKYGVYLKDLIDEKGNLTDIQTAQDEVNKGLEKSIALKIKEQSRNDISTKYIKQQVEGLSDLREQLGEEVSVDIADLMTKQVNAILKEGASRKESFEKINKLFKDHGLNYHNYIIDVERKIAKPIQRMKSELKDLEQSFAAVTDFQLPAEKAPSKTTTTPSSAPVAQTIVTPPNFEQEILNLKKQYAKKQIIKEVYEAKLDMLELAHLEQQLANSTAVGDEKIKLEQQIADKRIALNQKAESTANTLQEVFRDKDLLALKEQLLNRSITQEEYDLRTQQSDLAFLKKRLATTVLADKDRIALRQQIADKELSLLQKLQSEEVRLLEEDKTRKLLALKEEQATTLTRKEEVEARQLEIEFDYIKKRLALQNLTATERLTLEQQLADKTIAINEDKQRRLSDTLKKDQAAEQLALKKQLTSGTISKVEYDFKTKDVDKKYIDKQLARPDLPTEQRTDLEGQKTDGEIQKKEEKNSIRRSLGIAPTPEELEMELDTLNFYYEQGIISHAEYERLKTEKTKEHNKKRTQLVEKGLETANQLLSAGATFFTAQKERELAAAEGNEEKQEEIRKKYAAREKTMAIGQAMIGGALAIMQIWKSTATGNLLVDTPLKIAMTVAQAAMTAAQVATISAQQYAKGRYPVVGKDDGELYNADFTEKINTGIYDKPTLGLFSEKKPELVVDGSTTRKLLFNYPQIYNSIIDVSKGRTPQFSQGRYPAQSPGYTSNNTSASAPDDSVKKLLESNLAMMQTLANQKPEAVFTFSEYNRMIDKTTKYNKNTTIK